MTPTEDDWRLVADLMDWTLIETLHPEKNSVHVCVISRDGHALHYCGGHKRFDPLGDYRDMHAMVEAAMGDGFSMRIERYSGMTRIIAKAWKRGSDRKHHASDKDERNATFSAIIAALRAERSTT